jgi:HEPN domain-containing protein
MATHTVTLGDAPVELHRFKGFKATEMLTLLTSIYEEVPEIEERMREFRRKYREERMVNVPRAYYESVYPEEAQRISEEAWRSSGGVMTLPPLDDDAEPPLQAVILALFPELMKLARRRMFDVLSLAICPNSELAELDIDDEADKLYGPDGALAKHRKKLLHEAEAQQLFELAAEVVELVKDQFGGDDGLGKLRPLAQLIGALLGAEVTESGPEAPKPAGQSSSSSSAKRSRGGAAKRSSTRSRGAKSAASAAS